VAGAPVDAWRMWEHVPRNIARTARNERIPMEAHLNSRHRDTVAKIFRQPPSRNVEWREVLSLLEVIGTVTHKQNGKLEVSLGPETEVLPAPHGKDVDVRILVDLRRMLEQAGFAPDRLPAIADQAARDHGDGQWGEPS